MAFSDNAILMSDGRSGLGRTPAAEGRACGDALANAGRQRQGSGPASVLATGQSAAVPL